MTQNPEDIIAEITLQALVGNPLDDDKIRKMVIATAHAIAERQGIKIIRITTTPNQITIQASGAEIIALGLVTELRQLTNNWYQHQYHAQNLWGS